MLLLHQGSLLYWKVIQIFLGLFVVPKEQYLHMWVHDNMLLKLLQLLLLKVSYSVVFIFCTIVAIVDRKLMRLSLHDRFHELAKC